MSAYPAPTIRALDAQCAQQERAEAAHTIAHQYMRDLMLASITGGHDIKVPLGARVTSAWPVSTFLGECSREAQAKLFAACHAAMSGKDQAAAISLLREFVRHVAEEYAQDYAGDCAEVEA